MSYQENHESEIKARILTRLREDGCISSRAIIANEFLIFKSQLRADIAIYEDQFIGIEVKSEFDTLRRLPHQITTYREYFDKVILVVANKHIKAIEKLELRDIQIWSVSSDGELTKISEGSIQLNSNKPVLARLLTQRELHRLHMGQPITSASDSRKIFFSAFQERFSSTSMEFWRKVKRKKIHPSDLVFLSRYRKSRLLQAKMIEECKAKWSEWENILSNESDFIANPPILHQYHKVA